MSPTDLAQIMPELHVYHKRFHPFFVRSEARARSLSYIQGLFATPERKNVENIAEFQKLNVRRTQMFVTSRSHDHRGCIQELQHVVRENIGHPQGVLVLDDTGFPKDGTHSPGVARQYAGCLGKVGNCQIGVFLGYASDLGHTLVDRRLYLPESWCGPAAEAKRKKAGIPQDTPFQTKIQLAQTLLKDAHALGALPYGWVTADAAYGDATELRDEVQNLGKYYVFEVSCTTAVWLERPSWRVPEWSGRGRKPVHPQPSHPLFRLDEIAARLDPQDWVRLRVKEGEKGPREYEFSRMRVVEKREGRDGVETWFLVRRPLDCRKGSDYKYYLSNAPAEAPLGELARVGCLRWTIEEDFKLAKMELGLDHNESRKWEGWQNHTALCLLALGFLKWLTWGRGEKGGSDFGAGNGSDLKGRAPQAEFFGGGNFGMATRSTETQGGFQTMSLPTLVQEASTFRS